MKTFVKRNHFSWALRLVPCLLSVACGDDRYEVERARDAAADVAFGDGTADVADALADVTSSGAMPDAGADAHADEAGFDARTTGIDTSLDVAEQEDGHRMPVDVAGPAGFTITPNAMLYTHEGDGTATFTVRLNSQPTGSVVLPVTSSNPREAQVMPPLLTFTGADWNVPQTVVVTGVNDNVAESTQHYMVLLGAVTGTDASGYVGLDPPDLAAANLDDDNIGFAVIPVRELRTSEGGGQATFGMRLISEPTASVTVALTSSNINEGTVSPASVTFTPLNWGDWQQVVVTGVNDDARDGDQTYFIRTAPAVAPGNAYDGVDPADVEVTNADND